MDTTLRLTAQRAAQVCSCASWRGCSHSARTHDGSPPGTTRTSRIKTICYLGHSLMDLVATGCRSGSIQPPRPRSRYVTWGGGEGEGGSEQGRGGRGGPQFNSDSSSSSELMLFGRNEFRRFLFSWARRIRGNFPYLIGR